MTDVKRLLSSAGARSGLAAMTLVFALSCSQTGAQTSSDFQVYRIGVPGEKPVEIAIDPQNKGLGSELPWRLGVAFTFDELQRFFAPGPIPADPRLLKMLQEDQITMHQADGCGGYIGDAPVSMVYYPSKDHSARQAVESQRTTAKYKYQDRPIPLHGLLNYGQLRYVNTEPFVGSYKLFLPGERAFGFHMSCGLLESDAEGGCKVERDLAKNVHIKYSFCEDLLPLWRELDDLYFKISARILKSPVISDSYQIGNW